MQATRAWGTGTSSHAKHAARQVAPGDDLFVWQSGAGLIAHARIVTPARPVADPGGVPWPQPERYSYTFGITVELELDHAIGDRFKDHRSIQFGIRTHELQAGLIQLSEDVAASLRSALKDSGIISNEAAERPQPSSTVADETSDLPKGELWWSAMSVIVISSSGSYASSPSWRCVAGCGS